jgi:hypothetical protein
MRSSVLKKLPQARVAAPLYPGFPQSDQPPTREQYKAKREETSHRNSIAVAELQDVRRQAARLASANRSYKGAVANHPIEPVSYADQIHKLNAAKEAKRDRVQTDVESRLRHLEAEVASLKRIVVPARSAPLETLTQPVREITLPINQGAPQPARTASAPSGSGTPQTPYVPPHKVQERADPTPAEAYGTVKAEVHPNVEVKTSQTLAPVDENGEGWTEVTHKKRKGRALPPPVPSNHQMSTRNRSLLDAAKRQGGQITSIREVPAVNPRGDHLPVNPVSWNRLKCKTTTPVLPKSPTARSSPRRVTFDKAQVAAATIAAAIALLPASQAQPLTAVASHNIAFEDEGVFWAQVASALAIWALYVFTRYLAHNMAWCTCLVKVSTALASVIWTQHVIGVRAPTAALWQQAIASGTATPALIAAVTAGVIFARVWSHREQSLFKRARRL